MKSFAWVGVRPEGEKIGDNDYEDLMVDSGSQATIVSEAKMNRWIKKGAKVKKIPSKWKNIVTFSDDAMEVQGGGTFPQGEQQDVDILELTREMRCHRTK